METDTIAAIATATGRGGIGIIRLSGPDSRPIAQAITATELVPRHAHYCEFSDQQGPLDNGIALFFPGPHSFTGEDVVELQAHGGQVLLDLLLQECARRGARLARPGEFTERAFLNEKLDLVHAEAIADLINSSSEAAARSAQRSLKGEFSSKIKILQIELTDLRVFVEAALDFPEEEIDFIADARIADKLKAISEHIHSILAQAKQGALLSDGINIAIAGKPNAGKSSLLNRLAGYESAIVTDIAGTTRDVLKENISINGMPIQIVDTAGLRESPDTVEQEGIRRAYTAFESADLILLLVDASKEQGSDALKLWPGRLADTSVLQRTIVVRNKIDLTDETAGLKASDNICISANTGAGIDELCQLISDKAGYMPGDNNQFIARRRHLDALQRALSSIDTGLSQLLLSGAAELLAEDLRDAQQALGEITGELSADELLGAIFSSFCIGK
jgi:tRNA modification GTPase